MTNNYGRNRPYVLEFHVSLRSRQKFQFDQSIYSTNGNVIFADFRAARSFAQKMNQKMDLNRHPELVVRAGQINAMGLIDEILHLVVEEYRKQKDPFVISGALEWVYERIGQTNVDNTLLAFAELFPPQDVYLGKIKPQEYLDGVSARMDGRIVQNRELLLEEIMMLWLANENPAFSRFVDLFDDSDLEKNSIYEKIFPALYEYFKIQPKFGPDNENLLDMLQAPARRFPLSLSDQLEFIRSHWGSMLSFILIRLLSSLDMIREEQKPVFGFGGQAQSVVYEYLGPEYAFEPERFSQDVFWMPNLVLLAKNAYVWLDQLARKYEREINRLDQVPDEELGLLSKWGFTGLWLIGVWERSQASRKIKQMRGNSEAVASAYSLFSYDIAADLGGDESFQVLREKAWRHGIRLASDMVPNHMGIDSRWVIEHPDWFLQLSFSPFPSYTFNSANLSWDDRVGLYIEDHYYDSTDAAVVFKRVDSWTGNTRYIYHGNDGTSMPWNDTAQLNYLMPEVREAVIQTILHVASKFPIIRFDAAMTLAKRHYQRLWFPEPGSGGDIPSRAEHGMPKTRFDELFPEEFWRMVVDRVAQEAPDTLLLAEAFWLMEGYFVRTLGMHRVYNSAFMNMLRDEKNQEYRLVIKNTMEFDPQILKRFVNFMNNPDERTAVDQFGKGDKYFGICTMMVTMPGLPMFGHGQIEGFSEKYGMEFRYPKWHEQPDNDLIRRHAKEIFPLLRRRYLFAEAENFRLYDLFTAEGFVNEDVFAYSNQVGDQHALVIYNNRFANASGWIKVSAAFPVTTGHGEEKMLVQTTIAEALGLHTDPNTFTIFRNHIDGLEYIRQSQVLVQEGMFLELKAYEYAVFLDWYEVQDDASESYANLNASLGGNGVPSISEARREYELRDLLAPYRELVNPGMLQWLYQNRVGSETYEPKNYKMAMKEVENKIPPLLMELRGFTVGDEDIDSISGEISSQIKTLLSIVSMKQGQKERDKSKFHKALLLLLKGSTEMPGLEKSGLGIWSIFICTIFTARLGKVSAEPDYAKRSRRWIDELLFGKIIGQALTGLQMDSGFIERSVALIKILTGNQGWFDIKGRSSDMVGSLIRSWMADDVARVFLRIHPYKDILWFNKEAFHELVWWTFAFEVVRLKAEPGMTASKFNKSVQSCYGIIERLYLAEEASEFQLEKLLEGIEEKKSI